MRSPALEADSGPLVLIEVPIDISVGLHQVSIQLCQLHAPLDDELRPDAASIEAQVEHHLSEVGDAAATTIAAYPEACITPTALRMILEQHSESKTPRITVAGLALTRAARAGSLVELPWHTSCEKLIEKIVRAPREALVNLTAVVVTDDQGTTEMYPQLKLAPSIDELTPYAGERLVCGNEILIFRGNDLTVAAIACSDFFSRPAFSERRSLDELDFDYVRRLSPQSGLSILINHQYNRSPDHPYFREGLTRLFCDREYGRRLVVAAVNALDSKSHVVGRSQVLFHREVGLLSTREITETPVPARGYGIAGEPGSLVVTLDTPPMYWGDHGGGVTVSAQRLDGTSSPITTMVPPVVRHPIRSNSLPQLIARLSALGDYVGAERLAEEALSRLPSHDHLGRAEHWLRIAQLRRYRGRYRSGIAALAESERELERVDLSIDSVNYRFKFWSARYQRIWIETLQAQGACGVALGQMDTLSREIESFGARDDITDNVRARVKTVLAHGKRQRAEVLFLVGRYGESLELYREAEAAYRWFEPREMAYTKRGIADALRLKGDEDGARSLYRDVISYCDAEGNARLRNKATLGVLELDRTKALLNGDEATLREVRHAAGGLLSESFDDSFRLGEIQSNLIQAACLLTLDPGEAAIEFRRAIDTCSGSGAEDPMGVEACHALLGLAEALRLAGAPKPDVVSSHSDALAAYSLSGMSWGTARCSAVLQSLVDSAQQIADTEDPYVGQVAIDDPGSTYFLAVPWR